MSLESWNCLGVCIMDEQIVSVQWLPCLIPSSIYMSHDLLPVCSSEENVTGLGMCLGVF